MLDNTLNLRMSGPFELTLKNIDNQIRGRSPGIFALGKVGQNIFYVQYIGRSDIDLNDSLQKWVGMYEYFKWSYTRSELKAYKWECRIFHEFGETDHLDNDKHPVPQCNDNIVCQVCKKRQIILIGEKNINN